MDIQAKVEQLVKHIQDPIEREKKRRVMLKVLKVAEGVANPEQLAQDNGHLDGVPVVDIQALHNREDARLGILKGQRTLLFELEDEILRPETEEQKLNKRGRFGYTAIVSAVVSEDVQEVKRLLEAGADLTIRDNGGFTAMDKARNSGHREIMELLQKYGA
jgi:ankyrin repeat protein